ncbi:AMIN domain-containing protein [Halodesulfovibrio marinisediminis]|uniref:AMIN domain-containing protein n=1 Tax=Halodesulfovibrio marinisediminis DSM 17456 TaxID=1121457 RepID=A0A1N6IHX5_9BACT|nr:AMIN domain-containing protein [Halodesulfovibrio marinisediminis]SIO31585.1 AMIN domain-containing protein [Halodesulfovibrio marinisediminis DSM 17456]
MNRNISMMILLALVIGAVLIGYNKWMMRDAYITPEDASSLAVVGGKQDSQSLQHVVIDKSTSDILASAVSEVGNGAAVTTKAKQSPSLKVTDSQAKAPQAKTENTLTLVTKTVTVAVPSAKATVQVAPSKNVATSLTECTKKDSAQLSPLVSVSYSDKKLTVFATNKFTYKIFGLKEPDRFVVDVVGHFSDEVPVPKVAPDSLVKAVRLGHHDDRVRIVLDLKGKFPANWSATQTNGTLSAVLQ